MNIQDTRRERLAALIQERYDSQADFVNKTGQSQSEVSSLLKNKSFGEKKARKIEDAAGLPPGWLDGLTELASPEKLTPFLRVVPADLDESSIIFVRRVKLRLSAGITGFQAEDDTRDGGVYPVSRTFIKDKGLDPAKLIAIEIKGDSMSPALYEGDTVIVNTADKTPIDSEVFAINYDGEPVVKRLMRDMGQWWLSSDNRDQAKYSRKLCRDRECLIIGRVVKKDSNYV